MASRASDSLHLRTECFTKIGDQNRTLFETFMRATNQETLDFLHRRMEQRGEFAARVRHDTEEFLNAQQDFAKQSFNDWLEHAYKLSKLYWQTVEDRVEQTQQTIASIIPFAPKTETASSDRRKAA